MASEVIFLTHKGFRVRFNTRTGRFDITAGAFRMPNVRAGFQSRAGKFTGCDLAWSARRSSEGLEIHGQRDDTTLLLRFVPVRIKVAGKDIPAIEYHLGIRGEKPFSMEQIVFMEGTDIPAPRWMFLNAGRGWTNGCHDTQVGRDFNSATLSAWTENGQSLFMVFPMRQPLHCNMAGKTGQGLLRDFRVDCQVCLDDQTEVWASPLTLAITDKPHDFLENYGDRQRAAEFRPIKKRPVFWNSWDYIVNLVSEDYVLKNLEFIANDPVLSKHVEYIVIDDGWEHLFGDWEPNYKFPHGMEWIAKQIIERGFKPGLWLAPNVIENCSTMGYWNEHLCATSMGGRPCRSFGCMDRFGFALDIHKEEARQWLREQVRRYRDMGYSLIKLDYLRHITTAAKFNGQRVPKGDLIGEVIKVVREGVGDDVHLLGSVHRAGSGHAYVDSNRISGDIAPRWEIVCRNVRNIAAMWWAHNRLWCNDPDFAVVRGPDTCNDPNLNRINVNNIFIDPMDDSGIPESEIYFDSRFVHLAEARTLLSIVLLSGGSVGLSDNLPLLNEKGVDLLRKTVSAETGDAARPIDLFASDNASTWVQKLHAGGHRLGIFNWSDQPDARQIDVAGLTGGEYTSAVEYWTDEIFKIADGQVKLDLQPHEGKLLMLKD